MAKIRNTESYTLVSGTSDNDSIRNDGYNVTINGGDGNDTVRNYGSSVIIDGGAGNDSIYNNYESGGGSGGGGSCVGTCVGVPSGVSNSVAESNCASVTIFGGTGNDYIYNVKEGYNSAIDGGAGDDTIRNDGDNVTITGGKGNDSIKIYGENNLVKYSEGDGSDKIIGFRADSTLQIAGGSYSTAQSGKNIIVTVGDEKISLIGAASLSSVNIEANKLWSLDNDSKSNVTLGAEILFASAFVRTKAINIVGNALDNWIFGGSGKDTLYGADGNDYLVGNDGNDKLYGQNGNDILWGGAGNDSLKGGDGDDLFVYTAGNDVITDYTEDSDKISISAAISKSSIKGSDATFTIGNNTLTVKDGFGKEIVFIDENGKERTIIGGSYIANDSSSSKSTLGSWREVGDASERTKAIKLTGNALDNSILGGSGKDSLYGADGNDYLFGGAGTDKLYGQNGNDTLWGGIGNDTLKGGDGADVFIYESGEGKDVISGFENNDMLLITGAFSASYNADKKTIAFKVDSTANAITIKDFTATKFNINGINYKISGSKLVKK